MSLEYQVQTGGCARDFIISSSERIASLEKKISSIRKKKK
jgi:hypothetical protein